tara:strand:+ start:8872 stop:9003 length:132 start_codon:yes stop_codon:yes gene_type:complete
MNEIARRIAVAVRAIGTGRALARVFRYVAFAQLALRLTDRTAL